MIALARIDDLTERERAAVRALSTAVYPPADLLNLPGRHIEWAAGERCVRIWNAEGELVSYLRILVRQATHDGTPVRVGGIGGVITHPAARRQGYAAAAIERAMSYFREDALAGFGLLVCEQNLIAYYSRLGWQEFAGRLLVLQRGTVGEFTFNRVMVRGVIEHAPTRGTIDLCGPPW